MRNHYAQSVMVGNTAAMTPAVCALGISFLGALRTVRAHGEYNYRYNTVDEKGHFHCHVSPIMF